jgi:sorbitol/mannitol transport system substrate-binding protein
LDASLRQPKQQGEYHGCHLPAREEAVRSKTLFSVAVIVSLGACAAARAETTLTIVTVNNADMVVMQKYSAAFEKATGIEVKWLLLEENVLRQRVTTDLSTKGGQFDIITIGMFETPLWGKAKWLVPLDDIPEGYDLNDVIPTVRHGLSYDGKLYSLPFYAESTLTFYRTDLFKKAAVKMPPNPTWSEVAEFAAKLNDKANGTYGLCLRGQPGWGENMANSRAWKDAVRFYVDVGRKYGPPGMAGNGFNENLALFASGHCAIWVDPTVAAGLLFDPKRWSPAKLGSRRRRSRRGTRAMAGYGLRLWAFQPRVRM